MTKAKDDPLSEALAGAPEPSAPASAAAEMISLDDFVWSPGESVSELVSEPEDEGPDVTYDEADRGARTVTLLHPPRVDGELLRQVTMRPLEQGDIDDVLSGVLAGNRQLICRLTGLHPTVFKRLKWNDAEAVHQIFRDICPGFVTGEE